MLSKLVLLARAGQDGSVLHANRYSNLVRQHDMSCSVASQHRRSVLQERYSVEDPGQFSMRTSEAAALYADTARKLVQHLSQFSMLISVVTA